MVWVPDGEQISKRIRFEMIHERDGRTDIHRVPAYTALMHMHRVVKVGNCIIIIINVYLPCVGSTNREIVCEDLLSEVDVWCQASNDCNVVIAGDFNTDLDSAIMLLVLLHTLLNVIHYYVVIISPPIM